MGVGLLQLEKDMLVSKYDSLVANTVETFIEKQENLPKFFRRVRTSVAVLPTTLKYQHRHFLENRSSQIANATTIEEIFSILNSYCNFLNCSLLAHVINMFGDEEVRKELNSYLTALQSFRSHTKITDFIKAFPENSEIPPEFVILKMRMGTEWEHCTLEDIEEYRKSMAEHLSLADYAVYLMGGLPGSIYLLWSIPDHAVCIYAFTVDQHFSNWHSIEEVTIDGEGLEEYKQKYYLHDLPEFKVSNQII